MRAYKIEIIKKQQGTCGRGCGMMNDKLALLEYIDAIEQNYPSENYMMLREALDYCLARLKDEVAD